MLPQWVPLKADVGPGERRFLSLEVLVRESADKLFPGMQVVDTTLFRIVRNAQLELDEEENESLRESVTEALRQARFQPVVRVDLAPSPNATLVQGLVDRFALSADDLYEASALAGLHDTLSNREPGCAGSQGSALVADAAGADSGRGRGHLRGNPGR